MKETNFNYYNNMARKIASILPKDDAKLDEVINSVVDKSLSGPGFINTVSKPFKKLYFNLTANKDNLRKGIRNLYDPVADTLKQNAGNYIGNDFSKFLKHNVFTSPRNTMNYLASGAATLFSNDPENKFNKINELYKQQFPKNKFKDLMLRNIDKYDLYKKLNSGYFNTKGTAKSYADVLDKKLKNSLANKNFNNTGLDPIALLAKFKAMREFANNEKALFVNK